MTDRGEDELLGRLRRANPIVAAPGAAHSVDHALAEIGSLGRRRWTWRRLRHVEAGGGDGAIDGLLRAANPYPASTLNADAPVPSGALFWSVVAGPTRRQRGRLRSPRGLAVVVVATASLLASAFGYVFAERNVTNATTVRCYMSASLGTNYVGITPGASGPVGSCRSEVWSEGGFGSPTTPPLVGCVLANGVEAVFPGDGSTCTTLGLSTALAPTVTATQLVQLRKLLVDELDPDDRCIAPTRARSIVLGDLARTDFRSWAVRIAPGTSAARPCSQAYVLTSGEVIVLDPFPRLVHHEPVDSSGP